MLTSALQLKKTHRGSTKIIAVSRDYVFERKLKQFPSTLPPLERKSRKPVLANKYYVKRFNAQISTTY